MKECNVTRISCYLRSWRRRVIGFVTIKPCFMLNVIRLPSDESEVCIDRFMHYHHADMMKGRKLEVGVGAKGYYVTCVTRYMCERKVIMMKGKEICFAVMTCW